MMNIDKYHKAVSAEDALNVYRETEGAAVLGGCCYLRMGSKHITTAVDLSALGFGDIVRIDDCIMMGAMTSLREIETNAHIKDCFGSLFEKAAADIVGVQLRNCATIGGTVAGRYPFSDILTAMSVLDVILVFAGAGEVAYWDFINIKKLSKDILLNIKIKTNVEKAVFNSVRNSHGDYAVINCAVAKKDSGFAVSVGARPKLAERIDEAETLLNNEGINEKSAQRAAEICAYSMDFGSNIRGSEEYRRAVCVPMVKRAVMEVNHAG